MKYIKYLAIFAVCFVAACYLVPEFPQYPQVSGESIDELKLNSTGDRLLVRTEQYDYDFALPTRTLSLALAPLKHSIPMKSSDTPWYAHGVLSDLQFNTDGSLSSRLQVTFIGYDPELRALDIGLPNREIARLEKYGFTPFKNNYTGDFNATWSTDITGHRHDHNSLGAYSGADLLTCCSNDIRVILDTPEKMEHNHRLNAILRPLTVVTDAVKSAISSFLFLIYLLFGGKFALPSG
ncbi:hypothetical protein [Paraburkholderia sediminicola]|uniref:hypothetical protein n=1 Tax=Paraburkholderia sediminicola TaxID=458836 RepID=UPI0038BB924E